MNLLIGGSGFIGSALAMALAKSNEKVVSVARGKGDVPGVEYISADFHTETLPQSLLDRAENVFVLIGQIGPNFDAEAEKRILTKLVKTLSTGKQRVFFFSTVLVYGNRTSPVDEKVPCHPIGVYPQFKLAAEGTVQDLIPEERLVILRLANVYGSPKNRGFIGLAMQKVTNPADKTPLTIHGSGQQRRDYILIDDVVRAVLAVKSESRGFGIINIATGKSYSLLELISILSRVSGQKIPYDFSEGRPEAETVLVSNKKLREEYGYKDFASLEDGLRKTFDRYRKESKQ